MEWRSIFVTITLVLRKFIYLLIYLFADLFIYLTTMSVAQTMQRLMVK
jgi:hypothetical protein